MNSSHGDKIRWSFSESVLILLFLSGMISLNCNNLELESRWRNSDISIDGNHAEWEGVLKYSEEKRATVGIMNDREYLYLCLLSADQQVLMQAMEAGFTVWFQGSGKKEEKLIIRFPLGEAMSHRERFRGGENRHDDRLGEFLREQSEMVITQNDRKVKLGLLDLDDYGLEARIGQHMGRLVYEIRVPLHGSEKTPYAINLQPGKPLKVGFELGELKMPDRERRPRGDFRMGGGPGGMRGGGPPGRGRDFERPPEFKFEVSVKLADKATEAD